MPSALFLSPHLDDVAFSCAATLLRLRELGWQTRLITLFTATMPDPQGFALRCQTDKGLAPDVDYMALRRAEDDEFARLMGIDEHEHWPFAEAPHRGYNSGPQLFAGFHDDDEVWRELLPELLRINAEFSPDVIFAPQGIGNHVDHLHLIRAIIEAQLAFKTVWYRDTPYIIREPSARPSELLPLGLQERAVAFDEATLAFKVAGSWAYSSQINFQFGSKNEVAEQLTDLHWREAEMTSAAFQPVETAVTPPMVERFLAPANFPFPL